MQFTWDVILGTGILIGIYIGIGIYKLVLWYTGGKKKPKIKTQKVKHNSVFDKVFVVGISNLFILGYFTSTTGHIRSDVDIYTILGGLFFMDCLLLFLWKPLSSGKY